MPHFCWVRSRNRSEPWLSGREMYLTQQGYAVSKKIPAPMDESADEGFMPFLRV